MPPPPVIYKAESLLLPCVPYRQFLQTSDSQGGVSQPFGTMAAPRESYRFLRHLSLKAANLTVPSVTAESQHMETQAAPAPTLVLPAG